MKTVLFVAGLVFVGFNLIAQVQRKVADTSYIQNSSINTKRENNTNVSLNPGQQSAIKELNLSSEQKEQLKEMKRVNQSKRDAVMNNAALTEDQKKDKLKEIKRRSAFDLKRILTKEQIEKMKALRGEKSGNTSPTNKINE